MSRYYVKVYTDDSNVKEWEDLNPDEIHHIKFKGKRYDEVRHGKWKRQLVDSGFNADWHCSKCGWKTTLEVHGYNYCPSCGAKMDEVERNEN